MTDEELEIKLTRPMNCNDLCHQRIFSCIPLLWLVYSEYMYNCKKCTFSSVFLNVIKDWNIERNKDISLSFSDDKCMLARNELNEFYLVICDIYDAYLNNKKDISFNKINNLSLKHYEEISKLCNIYCKYDNRSKVISRLKNFKKKSKKYLAGIISYDNFIKKEILPQKEFLDVFIKRLALFEDSQFCIFMLCYDIKKTKGSIFTNNSVNR